MQKGAATAAEESDEEDEEDIDFEDDDFEGENIFLSKATHLNISTIILNHEWVLLSFIVWVTN